MLRSQANIVRQNPLCQKPQMKISDSKDEKNGNVTWEDKEKCIGKENSHYALHSGSGNIENFYPLLLQGL